MANTYVDRTGDGSETEFTFPFKYIQEDHVKVKVDDVIVDNSTEAPTGYTIEPASGVEQYDKIVFNNAPANNAEIRIYRDSRGDFSPLVDFQDGSVLTQEPLDTAYLHNLYVSQEASEGTGNELLNKKGGANYDAEGNKIINLGSPTTATDAATKSYVDQTIDNAELVGGSPATVSLGVYDVTSTNDTLKQLRAWTADIEDTSGSTVTSTGSSEARSLADRFADVINVLDYGATGDGETNDKDAIDLAITEALSTLKPVYFPAGSYYVNAEINIAGQNADRLTLLGAGRASEIWTDQAVDSVVDVNGTNSNTFQYVTINDLTIRTTNSSTACLKTRNTEFLKVNRCVFAGGEAGIVMSESGGESDVKPLIHDCVFAFNAYGIKGGDTRVADGSIKDNLFTNNSNTAIRFGYFDGGTISGNKIFQDYSLYPNPLVGINLSKPIYTVVEDNDFFELGGNGLYVTTPRYCRFANNQFINVGQNAEATSLYIADFDASVEGKDNQIYGNTFKNGNGAGIKVDSANSKQSYYKIYDNYFESEGDGGVVYDGIFLNNCSNFEIRNNVIDGNSNTRYWLYLDDSTDIRLDNNKHFDCINDDIFRLGTCTLDVVEGNVFRSNVTTTQTLNIDDDGVIGGTITGASIYINLPSASVCPFKRLTVTKTDSSIYSLILDPASTQTIDGASTLNVNTQYQTVTLLSDGSNWVTV